MIGIFIFIAGTLATGAALLLLLPLVRRRPDAVPAATISALAVMLVVLLGGAGLYAGFSNFSWSETSVVSDTPAAMTARLAKRLNEESGTVEDWMRLGRSYGVLGQTPLALRAYQRADRMANGGNAEAIMGIAELLVKEDVEELRGRAGRLFERALEIEPDSSRALFYSAFAALGRGETPLARERFHRLLAQEPDAEVRAIIEHGLASAASLESRADETPAETAKIAVRVSLAPGLAARVPDGATLFIAARDPQSPGPPFAVKRLAARFPVEVELTAADAMLESRRISAGQRLEVVARVALGGTPTASPGDPFGQVGYHVGTDGRLDIIIDRLAP